MRNGRYAPIHLHRQRIGTEIGTKIGIKIERYGDGEEQYILLAYLSGLVGLSVRFTLVRIGCQIDWFRFLNTKKKNFIFPN